MRKTVVVLTVVVLTLVLIVTPGLAAGGGGNGSTSFNLIGTISEITCPGEVDDGDITVVKTWPGTGEVDVVLDQDTLFKLCTEEQGEGKEISCALLTEEIGSEVRIVGDKYDSSFTARRVILLPAEE